VTTGVRERLPSPMALDGVVTVDYAARVFAVRLPDSAGGHAMSLWRQAYAQLVAAERSGWDLGHPFLWGGVLGDRQIVHGLPGDGLALTFHFPAGVPAYTSLISRPGLYAITTIDRELARFMSVRFLNRSRP
jgi:hypothetical protein